MADDTVVVQSPKTMAVGEIIAWVFDFSDIGTPTAITSFLAYDATGADKSVTTLSGAASIASDTVIGKLFTPATAQTYRLICTVAIAGNTFIGTLDVNVIPVIPATPLVVNGYCTLNEARWYIAPNSQMDYWDDEVLADIIEAVSRYIERRTNRTFYARTETHYYDVPDDMTLWLNDDELLTVTSLTNGDAVLILATSYNLLPRNKSPYYAIKLKDTSGIYWKPTSAGEYDGAITLVGTWGYSATAPADIKNACLQIAGSIYKRRYGENTTGSATITGAGVVIMPTDVPTTAQQIIEQYRMVV